MSYCRFGDESNVYVYGSSSALHCCMCKLAEENHNDDPSFLQRTHAIEHLLDHRAAGHRVPEHALERLRTEIESQGDKYEYKDPDLHAGPPAKR